MTDINKFTLITGSLLCVSSMIGLLIMMRRTVGEIAIGNGITDAEIGSDPGGGPVWDGVVSGDLKVWPEYFQLQWEGRKLFEIRFNDRNYEEGQWYWLSEYCPAWTNPAPLDGKSFCASEGTYTGRMLLVRVGYVMHGPAFGLSDGWVAFGYTVLDHIEDRNRHYASIQFRPRLA